MRVDASLGTTLLLGLEYYRPLGKSRFFVAPRVNAGRATTNVVPAKDTLANYRRSSVGAGIDLGYGVLSRTDEVRLGYEVRYGDTSVIIGDPNLPAFTGASNLFTLRWYHDGQDSATVPRRGLQLNMRGSWFLNSATSAQDFPQAEFSASSFHPVDKSASVFATASSGTTFNRKAPLSEVFAIGGPLRLSSYGFYELRGSDYALAGAGYLRQISGGMLAKWYAIGFIQAGRVFHASSADRSGLDATAGVVADTFIGPIILGVSVGDAGHRKSLSQSGGFSEVERSSRYSEGDKALSVHTSRCHRGGVPSAFDMGKGQLDGSPALDGMSLDSLRKLSNDLLLVRPPASAEAMDATPFLSRCCQGCIHR